MKAAIKKKRCQKHPKSQNNKNKKQK